MPNDTRQHKKPTRKQLLEQLATVQEELRQVTEFANIIHAQLQYTILAAGNMGLDKDKLNKAALDLFREQNPPAIPTPGS